jgi:DNA-binding NarL/FixJ family response regulator
MIENKRILIIDDHPAVRLGLTLALQQLDKPAEIMEAESCTDGIALIVKTQPDLVLLDLNLPDADGMNVINYVRKQKYNCKVIVFSERDERVFASKTRQAGASGFISKANELKDIVLAIKAVLGGNTCFRL